MPLFVARSLSATLVDHEDRDAALMMPPSRLSVQLETMSRNPRLEGVARGARVLYHAARRAAARSGFQLVYDTYDSPIPRLAELDPDVFATRSAMLGIDWNVEGQLDFVERELASAIAEFSPPAHEAHGQDGFYLCNGTYESVDAELLYAMVRRMRPRRIVELGSGFSTLVMAQAAQRNAADGSAAELSCYDPYPSPLLGQWLPGLSVQQTRSQDVPMDVFAALQANDVLFVDTSHTVKLGGDVTFIVLEVLPRLAPGVAVHFHDIFLPYNYSRQHLADAHFWAEQYLLQAFLAFNSEWEVLCGGQAMARAAPKRLHAVIRSFGPQVSPGAVWIRRTMPRA